MLGCVQLRYKLMLFYLYQLGLHYMLRLKAIYSLRLIIRYHQNILVNIKFLLVKEVLVIPQNITRNFSFSTILFPKFSQSNHSPLQKKGVACNRDGGSHHSSRCFSPQ